MVKKHYTSADVAREAGVSRSTVSNILNNNTKISISSETKNRVLAAVSKLGYHPDSSARSLKTKKSMLVGVVTSREVSDEWFARILKGIKEVISSQNYNILICSDDVDDLGYPEFYRLFCERKIDGVIFISNKATVDQRTVNRNIKFIQKEQLPAVFIDCQLKQPLLNSIDFNYNHGAVIMVEYILSKGYNKIINIHPSEDTIQEKDRARGIVETCAAHGIMLERIPFPIEREKWEENWEIVFSLIAAERQKTALIANWISLGFGALYEANKRGLKIPNDIAIASLSSSIHTERSFPRLTSLELPLEAAGRKSAEVLLNAFRCETHPVNISIACTLGIRESV